MQTKLVSNGQSEFSVVYAQDATDCERFAAGEFCRYVEAITGVSLPLKDDSKPQTGPEVLIGYTNRKDMAYDKVGPHQQGGEDFILKAGTGNVVIAGGRPRGTLYGVYTLLEEYFGCRWFAPDVTHIPKKSELILPEISRMESPALEYREPYFAEIFQSGHEWALHNRCNGSSAQIPVEKGGHIKYGAFVHTFNALVPPSVYGESHPEYYSSLDGKRVVENSQLCLTNPDVLKIAINKVRQWIKEQPDATIFSVSQNDWDNYCTCPACAALDAKEESQMGSLLHFVNAVAKDIEKDYPHVLIDTLAYTYSRKAPKIVRPRHNVTIRLCSIECCELHPIAECHVSNGGKSPSGNSFAEDLREWKQVCNRLYIWDYSANFHMYLYPHPTLQAFQPNMQFFVENNVKGVFHEGSDGNRGGGYCSELKAYIMAKLMWDPNCDVARHEREFLVAYYGIAAYKMKEIFDEVLASAYRCGRHYFFAMAANHTFTAQDDVVLIKCRRLFDEAERMAGNDEFLKRIKKARMWLRLMEICKMPVGEPGRDVKLDIWEKDCVAFAYDVMGCAPTMNVTEFCNFLREKSDTHP